MGIFEVIILSIIEGITEFLPISSTGHLIFASHVLQTPNSDFLKTFEISIQSGAVLAVINLYWKKMTTYPNLILKAVVGVIPTLFIGYLMYPFIRNQLLYDTNVVAISLIVGGLAIIIFEKYFFKDNKGVGELKSITYKQALLTGLTQSIAVIPGVSRSAASIFGGMFMGLNRKTATEFSFMLALPTILSATVFELVQAGPNLSRNDLMLLSFGMLLSFTVALVSIKWLLNYITKHTFTNFGWYRIVIGFAFILLFML